MATVPVHSGDNLQTALTNASAGDTLVLDAGATFTGHFTIGAKAAPGVIVTTSGTLPDRRIDPADVAELPIIASSSTTAQLVGTGATNWRFDGIQFAPTANGDNQPIQLQDADQIYLDRILIVGGANGQKRGVLGNGTNITLTRSYIANCWFAGIDSQGFAAWDGAGPYTITNNYIEAGSENILFGGSDSGSADRIPSDILVEDNYCFKRDAWRPPVSNHQIKNLFELKCAQRVIVRNNTFDGNWAQAQDGMAILFTPRNQGNTAPWSVVTDVLFERNTLINSEGGINITGHDNVNPSGTTTRITVRNCLFVCTGLFMRAGIGVGSFTMDHCTIDQGNNIATLYGPAPVGITNFTFTNNLARHNNYGIIGDSTAPGTPSLEAFASGYVFLNNVLGGAGSTPYPATTQKPLLADYLANFNADYTLIPGSAYRSAGTDGFDLGVIWTEESGTPPEPPPPPWLNRDIGAPTVVGTTSWAADVFTVNGEGADIGDPVDAFQLAWQLVDISKGYQIIARLTAMDNTNAQAKAGVMVRGWGAANSAHVTLAAWPGGTVELLTRYKDAVATRQAATRSMSFPVWLRIHLIDGAAKAAVSTDGSTWTSMGNLPVAFPVNVFGMVVCSKSVGVLNAATFDNASIVEVQQDPLRAMRRYMLRR